MSTIESPPADATNRVRPNSPRVLHVTSTDSAHRFEKIPCRVFRHAGEASRAVAAEIATLIRGRAAEGRTCVLGLATGSTPVGVYGELVRMHQQEGLSFQHVVTFNLDEYFPMNPDELQSYVRFMREHLFDHVDVDPANVHIPDGTIAEEQVDDYCRRYEASIQDAGGVDIQLLGIGRTGHIGFNEPGSGRDSRTPGRNAVESSISPSVAVSPTASVAFLTRLRNTWISWSRLAKTGGSEGSYSSMNLM